MRASRLVAVLPMIPLACLCFDVVLDPQLVNRILNEMDKICEVENFEELASSLLQRIDVVTNLSSSHVTPSYKVH